MGSICIKLPVMHSFANIFFIRNQPSCFQGYGHLKESQSVAASSSFPGIRIHKPEENGKSPGNYMLNIKLKIV